MHFYVQELSQSREDCGYRKCTRQWLYRQGLRQWLYRQGLIALFIATDFKNCYCCIIIYQTLSLMLVPSISSGVTNVCYIPCSKELVVDPHGLATAAGEGNCVGIHPTHDHTKVRAMASASSNIHRDPSPSWCPSHSLPHLTDHNNQHILQWWHVVMYFWW